MAILEGRNPADAAPTAGACFEAPRVKPGGAP